MVIFFLLETQGQIWHFPISRYSTFLAYKLPVADVYPLSQAFYKLEAGKSDHFYKKTFGELIQAWLVI